jgi:hypothetical protein
MQQQHTASTSVAKQSQHSVVKQRSSAGGVKPQSQQSKITSYTVAHTPPSKQKPLVRKDNLLLLLLNIAFLRLQ